MVMNTAMGDEAKRQLDVLRASRSLRMLSDSQLLSRYVNARDQRSEGEAAFCELVHRYGPMVLGICRQILRQPHDADDAFQATFLVLVREGAFASRYATRWPHGCAAWLIALHSVHVTSPRVTARSM